MDGITTRGLAIKKELDSFTGNIASMDAELTKLPDPTGEIASLLSKLADLEKTKTERRNRRRRRSSCAQPSPAVTMHGKSSPA